MENKICKIVYFDEDSVTDYVQIVAGGTLENTEELLKTREASKDQNAQATGKGGPRQSPSPPPRPSPADDTPGCS